MTNHALSRSVSWGTLVAVLWSPETYREAQLPSTDTEPATFRLLPPSAQPTGLEDSRKVGQSVSPRHHSHRHALVWNT